MQKVEQNGDEFVIEYGKKHKKIAIIIPYSEAYEKKIQEALAYWKAKAVIL